MSRTMGGMMGSQRPGAPPSGRRGGRRGRGGRAGRGKQRYQDPKLTPHYQSFLEKYGKGQPGAASQDPYYQRNPAYEQKQPQYGPPEGGWNPQQQQQWAGMSPGARTAMQTARRQQAEQASQFQGGQYQPTARRIRSRRASFSGPMISGRRRGHHRQVTDQAKRLARARASSINADVVAAINARAATAFGLPPSGLAAARCSAANSDKWRSATQRASSRSESARAPVAKCC
jgi:hypothetical protein